jgi:DNA topoisomerase IA
MSTTVSPSLEKATQQKLSKYTSPQLLSKLEGGVLIGLSKEVAIQILEKRKVDIKKFKPQTWIKPKASNQEEGEEEISSENTQEQAIEEEKSSKEKKSKRSKKELIDENNPTVKAILEAEGSKTKKIAALLQEGYSCSQISRTSIGAHISFCFSVKNRK